MKKNTLKNTGSRKKASLLFTLGCLSLFSLSLLQCSNAVQTKPTLLTSSQDKLVAFQSQDQLENYLKSIAKQRQKERAKQDKKIKGILYAPATESSAMADSSSEGESVTNVQHAGVDEGGIVKVHGDHLVILRRGRLFTVDIHGQNLKPISAVNAYGTEINPSGTWYDEMLISQNTIAVIGYSYQRGGTEIGLFNIDAAGHIKYRATYHLRSNDYYSSRNYASRLIGNQLIFYTPLYLSYDSNNLFRSFPAIRKWHKDAKPEEFKQIISATEVYYPISENPLNNTALHTVTTCDLAQADMTCSAKAVLGPYSRNFYVSPQSVYVWTTSWNQRAKKDPKNFTNSTLYRMPLSGESPSAIKTFGSPIDQFSFLEKNNHLNLLVRSDVTGDAMWHPEISSGDTIFMRIPLHRFSKRIDTITKSDFRSLPKVEGYAMQNRFVGDYLLYGSGNSWGHAQDKKQNTLYAYRYEKNPRVYKINLDHSIDRIEALANDAIIVGTQKSDLYFTPIALDQRFNQAPYRSASYIRQNASQGELRSHGFFYKAQGNRQGYLGLPVRGRGQPGSSHLTQDSASILFLKHQQLQFQNMGELYSHLNGRPQDQCKASCVDWYGNARPLFLRGRIFALLGYEIVEGKLSGNHLYEKQRVDFSRAISFRQKNND